MKAIVRIEIQNFQSHANTVIEPASAGELTVLTGPTDSGKSAVFRALRWLYYGGPVYIRTGCSAVSVSVHLDDGTVVTRSRASSANRYVVTRPGEEPQVFEGFGRDIPLEVQQALGVRTLDIAGLSLEVNLARQHDPAFLVSSVSAPARAKALGQIAGVEAVDLAMRSAGKDIFDGQRELKAVENEAAELAEQIRHYDYLPALAQRIAHVEQLVARLEDAESRKDRLVSAKLRLESAAVQEAEWEAVRRRTAGASAALAAIDRAQGLAARRSTLGRINRTLSDCVTREAEAREVVTRTAGAAQAVLLAAEAQRRIERRAQLVSLRDRLGSIGAEGRRLEGRIHSLTASLAAAAPAIETAAKLHRRSKDLRQIGLDLISIATQRVAWETKRDEAREAAQAARSAYARALAEAGRCPTCGGPVDHEHLKEVV